MSPRASRDGRNERPLGISRRLSQTAATQPLQEGPVRQSEGPAEAHQNGKKQPVPTIALDRRFFEWRDEQLSDPDLVLRWGRSRDLLPWDGVLSRRRVVLLAEAGSGKTEEMREQAGLRTAAGEFAVYMMVEDVARDGVEGA